MIRFALLNAVMTLIVLSISLAFALMLAKRYKIETLYFGVFYLVASIGTTFAYLLLFRNFISEE
jgi:ABC-type sugar transport system permease subunit